ncbi:hypothetical protein J5J86_03130 [Aquabacter sp. L1I39]|uniref:hypothetical protein n=1 Tax=Aquabacter sp. L1I39 TaxID=2820278 RepID=UPI001AD97E92|nr:hypothetical protein [Aquabacter sp. L1I39]QTL04352.1 hypothetical protein J5J86_03130 [Aquabacter sp. L1I39]
MTDLVSIEQEQRLVVLARTLDAPSTEGQHALEREAGEWGDLGPTCLGRSLYRHHSIFKSQSDAPVWSHAEFIYFRDLVPAEAIARLVLDPPPPGVRLLRAELLATTPGAFHFPKGWAGSAGRPHRKPSIEYLDVDVAFLAAYRDIMRRYIGPGAARLVALGTLGTFRTLETTAVLFQDPALGTTWNQVHLSEVAAEGFKGFGQELDAVLRDISPDGGFTSLFAELAHMRTIPRWTLNDPVIEADAGVGAWAAGLAHP